jgi:hypothetical protein
MAWCGAHIEDKELPDWNSIFCDGCRQGESRGMRVVSLGSFERLVQVQEFLDSDWSCPRQLWYFHTIRAHDEGYIQTCLSRSEAPRAAMASQRAPDGRYPSTTKTRILAFPRFSLFYVVANPRPVGFRGAARIRFVPSCCGVKAVRFRASQFGILCRVQGIQVEVDSEARGWVSWARIRCSKPTWDG